MTQATMTKIPNEQKSLTINAEDLPAIQKAVKAMGSANDIFQRLRGKKTELKNAKNYLKELIFQEPDAEKIYKELETAKENMKLLEFRVKDREVKIVQEIEDLKLEIKDDKELLDCNLLAKMAKSLEKGDDVQLCLFDEFKNPHIAEVKFSIKPKKKTRII